VKGQKGQSAVEFALVIPLFLILVVGMIYGGFAYSDYLQYGNAVRQAARELSVQTDDAKRESLTNRINNGNVSYFTPLTKLYTGKFHAEIIHEANGDFAQVRVTFTNVYGIDFLPMKDLQCTMPMEY